MGGGGEASRWNGNAYRHGFNLSLNARPCRCWLGEWPGAEVVNALDHSLKAQPG